jgi:hypothetical protein
MLYMGQRSPDVGLFVVSDDDDREDHSELLRLPAKSLPSCARLGRARACPEPAEGAPVPTRALPMVEIVTGREYATGGLAQKGNAGRDARRSIDNGCDCY